MDRAEGPVLNKVTEAEDGHERAMVVCVGEPQHLPHHTQACGIEVDHLRDERRRRQRADAKADAELLTARIQGAGGNRVSAAAANRKLLNVLV